MATHSSILAWRIPMDRGAWRATDPDLPWKSAYTGLPHVIGLYCVAVVNWGEVVAPSKKAMAPHSSTLAWKIPWTEEPGRLQSMGLLQVGHDWATSLSLYSFMHWRRKWQPTPVSCLENPRDGGAWWAAVYGVAQSRTRLKRLSSSSSSGPMWWSRAT